jgi:hypothetical protein
MERGHGPAFNDQTEYFRILLQSPLSSLKLCPLNFVTTCSLRYYKMGDVTFSKRGWCLRATGMSFGAYFTGRVFGLVLKFPDNMSANFMIG